MNPLFGLQVPPLASYFMDLSEQCGFTIEAQVNDFVLF